jgi:hypothetical protein
VVEQKQHSVRLRNQTFPARSRFGSLIIAMKTRCALPLVASCLLLAAIPCPAQSSTRSRLAEHTEPGAIYVEDILPKPVRLAVLAESVIYYQGDMQRPLGAMAPGTPVLLVAMTENAYKVRGRARHGDVAGWMRMQDLKSQDPQLAEKLRAFYDRQKKVDELIAHKQVALGMTSAEVEMSLGRPTRRSTKITAAGRDEVLEYSIYDKVPQVTTGRDGFGNLVQTTIYVKVEVGRLTIGFQDGAVNEINETMGNPLGNGGVQMVPAPVTVF